MTATGTDRLPGRASKDAAKYLLDDEEVVLATRRHWAVLIEPTLRFLPVFLVGGWLFLLDPDNRFTTLVGLVAVLVALVVFGLRVGEWWMRYFIVTRRRVLLTSGVIVRTVTLLPLRRITDLTWKETLGGQILGYGTFRFESAGQDQALRNLPYMPDAQNLYKEVSKLLFSSDWGGAASGGDDEGNPDPPPPPQPPSQDRRDTAPIPPLPPQQS
ncbi:PH domain-containing protein [Blastococcus sp. TF02A-30]|uniref:PH domain-containing protein n=1 Tax=Blastococcus sp. TF02A-30 TaxID=2250580 RepID=UPI001F407C98|nr:PH domain-containing protein [Blastococcus sp. TF02A-30]